ncbi:putative oxidoreductase [Streptomyces albus]|uniref:Putative oxidoreductase n=1 Tax=Streptomyces albus (strain ATCC 21838 / DSM 41398 / FERM P-419 / JCM 4703 / NBRC 107858) TaxID=1081613 RepID=A0A0B5ETN1_STRA4|nr:putative oxidoreductase [Streptomyces albus]AOU76408.1 putative oxidoreductase [Streptomyces albus]AYN32194.1 NADP-dependent oxidoreductase [Streptomyces albus]
MTEIARTVHQIARPEGFPTAEQFRLVESPLPAPEPGTALVENLWWSVDPYHREMMDGAFALHAPLEGRALGRVIASRTEALPEGEVVFHRKGWRTHAVVGPEETRRLPGGGSLPGVPLSAFLSVLGGTGLTAYVALTRTARLQPGEDVFISSAAGGVGSAAGRFARLLGARTLVGSAGSAAKAARLTSSLGFDAAFDYHEGPVSELLGDAAPEGLDVAVENVGGDHLEGAIARLREHGRIAWVGAVGQYHHLASPPPAPRNLYSVVSKSLRLEGVLVRNHLDAQEELYDFALPHLRSGRLVPDETVVDGFEHIVAAFLGMLRGENTGKMLVRATG